MSIGLTGEHDELAKAFSGFLTSLCDGPARRERLDDDGRGVVRDHWTALHRQGLLGLHLSAEAGGDAAGGEVLAIAVEEAARALLPGPYVPTLLTGLVLGRYGGPAATGVLAAPAAGAPAATALTTGTLTAATGDDGGLRVGGTVEPVAGAAGADLLLLGARGAGPGADDVWFVVRPRENAGVRVEPLDGLDLTRGVARVHLDDVTVDAADVVPVTTDRVRVAAAVLLAAEAVGLARWCVETGVEYVKIREQFGRPVGSFQAIKHKCARMRVRLDLMAAAAWDAARALDDPDEAQLELAAAAAAVVCLPGARETGLDTITLLGGIGYTWEHDTHLYWRRAAANEALLAPVHAWRTLLGERSATAKRSLEVTPEEDDPAFRECVRATLAEVAALPEEARRAALADAGLVAPHYPRPYGLDADASRQIVVAQEYRRAGLEQPSMVIGEWAVPTILAHGTDEQVAAFVPASLRGDLTWCQLFSEPQAGSDLASLRTRAVKVDGGWRINGQKVWNSSAHEADFGICLVRTDPDVPKHKGLSYFLVDMRSPGVEVRPLREANGRYLFNEVFLTDVFVPDERLVAAPGDGWRLARTTLGNERVNMGAMGLSTVDVPALATAAAAGDPAVTADFGDVTAHNHAVLALGLRATLRRVAGLRPGAEASVLKLAASWRQQATAEAVVRWAGPAAAAASGPWDAAVDSYLSVPAQLIGGGTAEIQLNVIAEHLLGLPRDPAQR